MNKKSLVSELMTKNVVVANLGSKLEDVLQFFSTYKVQHLPITSDEKLIGIISLNDVIDYIATQFLMKEIATFDELKNNFNINKVMTANPKTVAENDHIDDVIKILANASFQSVLVTQEGKLVGIVTKNDLVRFWSQL
jgi:CBS domain-containing membrane protein